MSPCCAGTDPPLVDHARVVLVVVARDRLPTCSPWPPRFWQLTNLQPYPARSCRCRSGIQYYALFEVVADVLAIADPMAVLPAR